MRMAIVITLIKINDSNYNHNNSGDVYINTSNNNKADISDDDDNNNDSDSNDDGNNSHGIKITIRMKSQ